MVRGRSARPAQRIRVEGVIATPYAAPPDLLGLIAGCEYAPIGETPAPDVNEEAEIAAADKKEYAGLAVAMNGDAIRETIALF
jgi:hypothetical protein